MKLRDARKVGIKYCENNNCNYACISYSDEYEYTVTDKECKNTVYFINRNGSLDAYLGTNYAANYHKQHEKREKGRGKNGKKELSEICNYVEKSED